MCVCVCEYMSVCACICICELSISFVLVVGNNNTTLTHRNTSQQYKISFFVQSTSSVSLMSVISFDQIIVNDGGGFVRSPINTFLCPRSGIYWFQYSICWNGLSQIRAYMLGTKQPQCTQISRMHDGFNKTDVISKTSVHTLEAGQYLVLYNSEYDLISDNEIEGTGWGAFLLDTLMSPLVIFEVSTALRDLVSFNNVNINIGSGWARYSQKFIVNITGLYYFTFSISIKASENNKNFTAYLNTSNHNIYCTVKFSGQSHYTEFVMDTLNRGCLLLLNETDEVSLAIANEDVVYTLPCGVTSFRGFLYSPLHNVKVAWSVHNSSNLVKTLKKNTLHLTEVLVNTNGVWNTTTNSIGITISGVYYLEIVGSSAEGNSENEFESIDMCVMKNSSTPLLLLRFAFNKSQVTRSNSAIARLQVGDKLTVTSMNSGVVMSGFNMQGISFQGFLLYTDS